MTRRFWIAGAVVSVLAIIAGVVIALTGGGSPTTKPAADNTTPTAGPTSAPAACWTVKFDANKGNNVLSGGVTGTPSQVTRKLLAAAQKDPRVLQAMWSVAPEGRKAPVSDWHELVDSTGKCYSAQGQELWNEVAVIWHKANATKATAPKTGCNYYVVPRGNASCKVEVITGDRSGTKYVFEDGTVIYVMYRCANPVVPGTHKPPSTPPSTPPSSTPSPTPSKTCTPPWYAGHKGYKQVGPCKWVKDNSNTFNCQQNHDSSKCPPNHATQPPQIPGNGVQSTATNPVPGVSTPPSTLPAGPGKGQAPPSSAVPSGYNPSGGSAPGGGSSNGGSTTVRQPNPSPTPGQGVPSTDPVNGPGTPGQPG